MKKIFFLIFTFFTFTFFSCNDIPDNTDSFPVVDYSELIQQDSYKISPSTTAITVFNLFYNVFGYGEHTINGTAVHTESADLIGITHTETISCNITKVKIYHIDNSTKGSTVSTFYVDFINSDNEVLSYCYQWQYKNTNAWENGKTSTFFQSQEWYKKSDSKTKTSWDITITR